MKGKDKQKGNFLSFAVDAVGDGEESRFHSGSVSVEADIAKKTTGTIEGDEKNLKELPKPDEIYMTVRWNDDDTDGDQEEKIILYNKDEKGKSFLDWE